MSTRVINLYPGDRPRPSTGGSPVRSWSWTLRAHDTWVGTHHEASALVARSGEGFAVELQLANEVRLTATLHVEATLEAMAWCQRAARQLLAVR